MAEQGFKRKLTAILSADVEGYSRLMDDDEEATVRTLTTYRTAINDLVQQYRGRIVDNPGDNILSEPDLGIITRRISYDLASVQVYQHPTASGGSNINSKPIQTSCSITRLNIYDSEWLILPSAVQ